MRMVFKVILRFGLLILKHQGSHCKKIDRVYLKTENGIYMRKMKKLRRKCQFSFMHHPRVSKYFGDDNKKQNSTKLTKGKCLVYIFQHFLFLEQTYDQCTSRYPLIPRPSTFVLTKYPQNKEREKKRIVLMCTWSTAFFQLHLRILKIGSGASIEQMFVSSSSTM